MPYVVLPASEEYIKLAKVSIKKYSKSFLFRIKLNNMKFCWFFIYIFSVFLSCLSEVIIPKDTNSLTLSECQVEGSTAITKRDFPWYTFVEVVTTDQRIRGPFLIWISFYSFGNLALNLPIVYDECRQRERKQLIPRGQCRKAIKASVWYLSTSAVTIYGLTNAANASLKFTETIEVLTKAVVQLTMLLLNLSIMNPQDILPNGNYHYLIIIIMMGCMFWNLC